jgi:hypothetical protein
MNCMLGTPSLTRHIREDVVQGIINPQPSRSRAEPLLLFF